MPGSDPLTTRTRPEETAENPTPVRTPALTILYHPDVTRVGEQARLTLEPDAVLSRAEPLFCAPGRTEREPLADPHLSRRGFIMARAAGGVRLALGESAMTLHVDGEPLRAARDFDEGALDRGVVLELAGRVVLLLHRLGPAGRPLPRVGLVGDSEAMARLTADILRVSDLAVPVLLRGETGSGKELVARAIHEIGPRAARPLVTINMAVVPASTAASELFGHARGAFTGAVADHDGHFVRADGGTLFLDEIGDTPHDVQAMMLRTLETGEVLPLGGRRPAKVNVRVIAATDSDLERDIEEDRFRDALYHRLAGFVLSVPALRERRDDFGRLLIHFLREELRAVGEEGKLLGQAEAPKLWLAARAVAVLAQHAWPGNVRQLRNVARQIVIANRGEEHARVDSILAGLARESPSVPAPAEAASSKPARRPAEIGEAELIEALRQHGWRTGATADALGISKTSLYGLIDKSQRIRKARDVSREELVQSLDESGGDVDAAAARLEVSPRGLRLRMKDLGL